MGVFAGPEIKEDGLVLALDAGNTKSYTGSGTTWTDKVGGNNGTLVNGTYHNDGPFVGAGYVEFDGTDDYLSLADSADLRLGTGTFTIEAWIYPHTVSPTYNSSIVVKGSTNAAATWQFDISNTSKLRFQYDVSSSFSSSSSLVSNVWTHVAVVREGTGTNETKLYINGVLDATGTVASDFSTTDIMKIARNRGGGTDTYYNGYISNVRVIKGTALYTSDFTPPTGPLTAVTNTTLLTCQGNTIADASSSAHTITANGDAAARLGFPASAFEFDGTDDEVSISSYQLSTTNSSAPYTLSAWINRTGSTTDGGIITQYVNGTSAVDRFGLREHQGGKLSWWKGGNDLAISPDVIPTNVWKYVVGVKRSDQSVSIYVDGIEVDTGTDTLDFENGTLRIGRFHTLAPFSGKISQVSIYNKALTAAEVEQNYNALKGRYA